jgi:hypothetical protein
LAGGSIWLAFISTAFVLWALLAARSSWATSLLVAMLLAAAILTVFGITLIRRILKSPFLSSSQPVDRSNLRRRFRLITVVECLGFMVVSLACVFTHQWALIAPLNIIVVGLHFLPLARLFNVPRYTVMGVLFCGIPILTMLFVPRSAHTGHAFSWLVLPTLGCALVAFTTAFANLNEVRRSVMKSETPLTQV